MKTTLMLLSIILFNLTTKAQKWTTYTKADGLANNIVYCMAIDVQGNKWFGFGSFGSGISKFDGNQWTTYNSKNGIIGGIHAIAVNKQGEKWFGTDVDGLYALFGNSSQFTNYHYPESGKFYFVNAIAFDSLGYAWYGTLDGAVYFLASDTFTIYNGLANNDVRSIIIDSLGNKWFATNGGLSKFDGSKWTTYTSTNSGLASNFINALALDAQGNIWVGTGGNGISKFDGKNWVTYTTTDGLANNVVTSITIDSLGNKWFGTYGGGVSKFDGTHWTNYSTTDGLASNTVYCIAIDGEGNKWFGTRGGGVSKLEDETNIIINRSLENQNSKSFSTYPNPAINKTTIKFPYPDNYNLIITDLSGKAVKQFTKLTNDKTLIETDNMESGIYLLSLINQTSGITYRGKLIVSK